MWKCVPVCFPMVSLRALTPQSTLRCHRLSLSIDIFDNNDYLTWIGTNELSFVNSLTSPICQMSCKPASLTGYWTANWPHLMIRIYNYRSSAESRHTIIQQIDDSWSIKKRRNFNLSAKHYLAVFRMFMCLSLNIHSHNIMSTLWLIIYMNIPLSFVVFSVYCECLHHS